jgi:hypothetical protein
LAEPLGTPKAPLSHLSPVVGAVLRVGHDLHQHPGVCDWDIYGWGAMAPELEIGAEDYVVGGAMETDWAVDSSELFSVARDRQLSTLLYFGTATQICLTFKPVGMLRMQSLGTSLFIGAIDIGLFLHRSAAPSRRRDTL